MPAPGSNLRMSLRTLLLLALASAAFDAITAPCRWVRR